MQTDIADNDNYSATRVTRQTSSMGSYSAFYLGRETDAAEGYNRIVGGDIHLSPRRTMDIDVFAMRSASALGGNGTAGRGSINLLERGYTGHVSFTHVGEQFRNDLGFIPRENIDLLSWQLLRHLRSASRGNAVLTYTAGVEGDVYWGASSGNLETRSIKALGEIEFADGGILQGSVTSARENLFEPFTVADLPVQAGEYEFVQTNVNYASNQSRALSGNIGVTQGGYWSGDLRTIDFGVRARLSKHVALSATGARSRITFDPETSQVEIVRLRADWSFSTRMFLNAFAQYSSDTHTWTSNVRFRFTYRPLSDLFVVYSSVDERAGTRGRSLAVKTTILLNF
jgi:hypothetical protein